MKSLYDELAAKMERDPSLIKRSGPRQDIGLLLFAERDKIDQLWKAAERRVRLEDSGGPGELAELKEAVERLRPLFGERRGA